MSRQQAAGRLDQHRLGARSVVVLGLLTMLVAGRVESQPIEIELPSVVLTGVPFSVTVRPGTTTIGDEAEAGAYRLRIGDRDFEGRSSAGGGWVFERVEVNL